MTELSSVIAAADLPALRTVINSHALRCIADRAAVEWERAGESARAAAENSYAQRQAAEGVSFWNELGRVVGSLSWFPVV